MAGFRIGPGSDPDRYRVDLLHSSGAEGQLWRGARELDDGVELAVAIKILQPDRENLIDESRERWEQHVDLLRSLQYPGVVTVREAFEGPPMHAPGANPPPGRNLYLVMNWVDGVPLNEWVSRRAPDANPFDGFRILTQVADALDYLHSGRATNGVPVLHRDVKPANIITTEHGAVLVDFGLMRALSSDPAHAGLGTPGYMAPETLRGEYTPASDRYALGAVAYYILTGDDPPEGGASAMRPALERVRGIGSASVIDNLLSMVDPDPQRRPKPAASWAQPFRASTLKSSRITPDAPMAAKTVPVVADTPVPREMPKGRVAAMAGLGVLLLVVVALVLSQRGGGNDTASGRQTVTSVTTPTTVMSNPTTTNTTSAPTTTIAITTVPTSATTTTTTRPASALPYTAVWSGGGQGGWFGPSDWKVLDGVLLNDGSGEYSLFKPIIAPPMLNGTPNYVAEAEIRVTRDGGSSFGIAVRVDGKGGGYGGGVGSGWRRTSGISDLTGWWGTSDLNKRLAEGLIFSPGTAWHKYRLEVRGNRITFMIDGSVLAEATDNTYLNGGRVGLWCDQYQLEVRSFQVTAL